MNSMMTKHKHMKKDITNCNSWSVESILKEVSKRPLLTIEQEIELTSRIQKGDEEALRQLVNGNLRFVVSVANLYLDRGLCLEELIEAGNIGLEQAAKRFLPERGFKFISYVIWFIRASMLARISIKDSGKEPSDLTVEEKKEIVSKLTNEREKAILIRWFGLDNSPESLQETGQSTNLTAKRVRQIREESIRKLSSEQDNPATR